ncbi:MAG: two-component system response regulator, partial [Cytophagales bacterium]|nr:two-component system response regulator [Cytophagales bacterium]
DMAMIKELAGDEASYRSITKSWFAHSPLLELIQKIADKKGRLMISTDHGTIRVNKAVKVVGDRETNTNLRYKQGKNLSFDEREVFFSRKPERLFLPKRNISTTYIFAEHDSFLAYPNNYNYYVGHYKDTFQHGGISMEEIIVPIINLKAR